MVLRAVVADLPVSAMGDPGGQDDNMETPGLGIMSCESQSTLLPPPPLPQALPSPPPLPPPLPPPHSFF